MANISVPTLTHPPNRCVNTLVFQRGKHTIAVSFTDRRVGEVSSRYRQDVYVRAREQCNPFMGEMLVIMMVAA